MAAHPDLSRFAHLFDPESLDMLDWTLGQAPSLRSQIDGIVARALQAGAQPPLRYMGAGQTGVVLCDRRPHAFKVARRPGSAVIADEAEWLATAATVPGVREHVAKLYAWHPAESVIERECMKAVDLHGRRGKGEGELWDLHRRIEKAMLPFGWGSPELKADSYVLVRGRGYVLVDAGFVHRAGSRLARRVADMHRQGTGTDALDYMLALGNIRQELGRTIDPVVGQRLHDRLQREGPRPTKANDARAAREGRDGLRSAPARLTRGHDRLPEVIAASKVAARVTTPHFEEPGGYGGSRYLGEGNFGIAYVVESPSTGRHTVKVPTARSIHRRPWTRTEQAENLMHEAGVANELGALGLKMVPRTTYTTFGGGTPALVREYGEPVVSLTPAEYAALEAELVHVERDLRWRVADELSTYRRADGSVYVGDVGFWRSPRPRARGEKSEKWDSNHSNLDVLLSNLQQLTMGRQFTSLPVLLWEIDFWERTKPIRSMPGFFAKMARQANEPMAARDAAGVPTPPELRAKLAAALRPHL